jgi:mannitol/fructose-specific phosphotransferase system IIA component (Ntr-type)
VVHLLRHLRPNLVRLELASAVLPPDIAEYREQVAASAERGDPEPSPPVEDDRVRWRRKEAVVREIVSLFDASGEVRNTSKFTKDLLDRERKSTTAVGGGLAIPHVRSMQPRRLIVCLARSQVGAEYLCEDGSPVHVFMCVAAPSYDDSDYWKLYRWLAQTFSQETWLTQAILDAEDENEIVHLLKSLR